MTTLKVATFLTPHCAPGAVKPTPSKSTHILFIKRCAHRAHNNSQQNGDHGTLF